MRKLIATSAITLCAVFNAHAANASTTYTLSDDHGHSVNVIEFTHQDARNLTAITGKNDAKTLNLRMQFLVKKLKEHGVEDKLAVKSAWDIYREHRNFDTSDTSISNNGGPFALPIYKKNYDQAKQNNRRDLCLISTPDLSKSTAQDWARFFSSGTARLQDDYNPIYDVFFRDFIDFHEKAHCLEANEEEADYYAAQHLIVKYGQNHKQDLKDFFQIVSTFRQINEDLHAQAQERDPTRPVNNKYQYTPYATYKAIHDLDNHKYTNKSPAKIWSKLIHKRTPNLKYKIDKTCNLNAYEQPTHSISSCTYKKTG